MATSRIPAVIDYLFTTFQAASTLGQAAAPNTVAVYDGPVITGEPARLVLWVGIDDPNADVPQSASSDQSWAALGKQSKNEQVSVNCTAQAWGGETDVKALRTQVFALVSAVEDILRADVMAGGIFQFSQVTGLVLYQNQPTQGFAQVAFQIEGQARI
jgi:hypothetical protein